MNINSLSCLCMTPLCLYNSYRVLQTVLNMYMSIQFPTLLYEEYGWWYCVYVTSDHACNASSVGKYRDTAWSSWTHHGRVSKITFFILSSCTPVVWRQVRTSCAFDRVRHYNRCVLEEGSYHSRVLLSSCRLGQTLVVLMYLFTYSIDTRSCMTTTNKSRETSHHLYRTLSTSCCAFLVLPNDRFTALLTE